VNCHHCRSARHDRHGVGQYAQRFTGNDIDFRVLPDLTDQDLKDLGNAEWLSPRKLREYISDHCLEIRRGPRKAAYRRRGSFLARHQRRDYLTGWGCFSSEA
jgi:hypothetical protein